MVRNIDTIIRSVNGTMSLEGMPLTEGDKKRMRDLSAGRTNIRKELRLLSNKYLN